MEYTPLMLTLIGLVLEAVGAYFLLYYEAIQIEKIKWDFQEFDDDQPSENIEWFKEHMTDKKRITKLTNYIVKSVNDSIDDVNTKNIGRRKRANIGAGLLIVGSVLQVCAVIILLCQPDANF